MVELALMEAREKLSGLNRELQARPETVVRITNRGKPALALLSAELYDSLIETLDVLTDPEAAEALRKSLSDIQAGRVHSLAEVAKRLDLRR
ncbi:MAG: type II toxin-antitoxin system prevent-host-death family antitoxin [Acidobacteriota bacterium]|nr:type II toxin-antitoxin system prevent-host-death family antitoxin [Acidobacteriota bacterium]